MGFRAVSHIAVGVRDMDRMLGFYRDLLGLRVTADEIEAFSQGPEEPPAQRRAVYLRWEDGPDASFLVLDQQITKPAHGEPPQLFQVGCHHFGFWVDDLGPVLARMRAAGVTVQFDTTAGPGADTLLYGEAPGGRVHAAFFQDPEGNWVQLDQRVAVGS